MVHKFAIVFVLKTKHRVPTQADSTIDLFCPPTKPHKMKTVRHGSVPRLPPWSPLSFRSSGAAPLWVASWLSLCLPTAPFQYAFLEISMSLSFVSPQSPFAPFLTEIIFLLILWERHLLHPDHTHFPVLPCLPLDSSDYPPHTHTK